MRSGRPARRSAPGGYGSAVEQWAAKRRLYLDNLKVVLIAAVIAMHAMLGYSDFTWWPYSEMKEVTLAPVTQTVLIVVVGPVAVLMMPLMFLLAGLLTAPSLARKGPAAYARDRLLRLGVPFAAFVLLLWPLLMYPIHPPGQAPRWEFLGSDPPSINTGPLWFVGVLLIFSLVYTGWVRVRRGHGGGRPHGEVRARHLLLLAGAAIVATFLVRLVVPLGGTHIGLNLWEWPACATLFGLGITGFAKGWLTAVPDRLCRRCRAVTLAALVGFAMFAVFGAARARGVVTDQRQWGGGWHWLALVFAALECTLAVFGSVWLLGGAQRHLDRAVRWAGPAVGRSAFAAFVLQGLVLIGLAVALRPFPLPAEVKALLVAVGGGRRIVRVGLATHQPRARRGTDPVRVPGPPRPSRSSTSLSRVGGDGLEVGVIDSSRHGR